MLNTKTKAIICGFIFSVLFSFLNFTGKCEGISNKILRLHIIANSDTREDQELKLKVRDRVLNDFGYELQNVKDIMCAENIAMENLEKIKIIAQDEITKNGFDYCVNTEIVNMHFNTRSYENITLPAGNYNALRITIGKACGKNWWCVMFPPLCLPACSSDMCLNDVLNDSECSVVSSCNYEIEFKIIEIFTQVNELVDEYFCTPIREFLTDDENFEFKMDLKLKELF